MILKYVKQSFWDYLLCVIISVALTYCMVQGFYIDLSFGHNLPLLIGLAAVCVALFFAGAYNRRSILIGIIAFVVVGVIVVVMTVSGAIVLDGNESGVSGHMTLYVLTFCISAGTFLLSRLRGTAALIFPIGSLIVAGTVFLEYGVNYVCLFVLLLGLPCLYFYRNYRYRVLHASTKQPAFKGYALVTTCICLVALLLSSGVYYGIVKPLHPGTLQVKLITQLEKLPLMELLGISSHVYIYDPGKTTADKNDEEELSNQKGKENQETEPEENPEEDIANEDNPVQNVGGITKLPAQAISYMAKDFRIFYVIAGLILLIALVIYAIIWLRKRRYKKLIGLNFRQQICYCYGYFLKALAVVGLPPRGTDTPIEYGERLGNKSSRFFGDKDDFMKICRIFDKSFYGDEEPTPEELNLVMESYRLFPKNARKGLGIVKYARKFFKL